MRRHLGVVLIILVALNLRPAVTAVGPLLSQIQDDLGLSGFAAGALTALPLLFFGSFGLVAPFLRRTPRGERLLVLSMALLVVSLLARVIPQTAVLFAGSLLAGIAISIGNIAIPSIIKRDHAGRIPAITAGYTVALTCGASLSSGSAIPIERALGSGWRPPLALLAIPAALAGLAWLPRARRAEAATLVEGPHRVWRSGPAWHVTGFMGMQALLAYVVIGWLPTILQDRGLGEADAGYAVSLSALIQAIGALSVPLLERRLRDQRPLVLAIVAATAAGFAGVFWAPVGSVWVWVVVLGYAQGAAFALALTFIGLRSADAHVAAQLSGMSQGIGYAIAALGPIAIGVLHDATNGWTVPAISILALTVILALPGLGAGRTRTIAVPAHRRADLPLTRGR